MRIDTRWGARDPERIHRLALELAALAPDVILAHGISTVGPLRQATRTVPIVFPVMEATLESTLARTREVASDACSTAAVDLHSEVLGNAYNVPPLMAASCDRGPRAPDGNRYHGSRDDLGEGEGCGQIEI